MLRHTLVPLRCSGRDAQWGAVDVLVDVAGGIKMPIVNRIWEVSDEQLDTTIRTNLGSTFRASRSHWHR